MQLSANNIEHILLISCALYVFVECFACARQVIAAERGIGKVPTGFRNKLSLAAHQKAAAFTSESAQSRLVLAFVSAAFAVLMTTGHGLTYLTALFETLTDNTLLVQWSLLVSIMGAHGRRVSSAGVADSVPTAGTVRLSAAIAQGMV